MPLLAKPKRYQKDDLVVASQLSVYVLTGHPEDVRLALFIGYYDVDIGCVQPIFQLNCYLNGAFKLYPCWGTPDLYPDEDEIIIEGVVLGKVNEHDRYDARRYLKLVARGLRDKYYVKLMDLAWQAFI